MRCSSGESYWRFGEFSPFAAIFSTAKIKGNRYVSPRRGTNWHGVPQRCVKKSDEVAYAIARWNLTKDRMVTCAGGTRMNTVVFSEKCPTAKEQWRSGPSE